MPQKTLIIGGTRGLGRCIRDYCMNRGDYVMVASKSQSDFRTSVGAGYKCNLSNLAMVDDLMKCLDGVEIDNFFWVAGVFLQGRLAGQTTKQVLNTVDINFRNSLMVAHSVWCNMEYATSAKKFVVVSSISGLKSAADEAVYDATKHAQVGFARALIAENKNPNVQVGLIMPSSMQTDMQRGRSDFDSLLDPQKVTKRIFEEMDANNKSFELVISRGSI